MENKLEQEPEFACECMSANGNDGHIQEGMSQRVYAAIQLRVPDSGEEWLDEMIRKANRRDAACTAMQGLLGTNSKYITSNIDIPIPFEIAKYAFEYADELLTQETK